MLGTTGANAGYLTGTLAGDGSSTYNFYAKPQDDEGQFGAVRLFNIISTYPASGGTITTYGGFNVHTFLLADSGDDFTPAIALSVDYLIVAGGGGGGRYLGGGGAGGFRTSASSVSLTSGQDYPVVVGAGGAGTAVTSAYGAVGGNSSFNSITSNGGGGGASQSAQYNGAYNGMPGGSGGGATNNAPGVGGAAIVTSPVQGYKGGNMSVGQHTSGGGGGGAGGEGTIAGIVAGAGGVGRDDIMGLSAANSTLVLASAGVGVVDGGTRWLAGGGGGAFYPGYPPSASGWGLGLGGKGGGGNGAGVASYPSGPALAGQDGVQNTGSGGGGGSTAQTDNGVLYSAVTGDGANGVVIIRYAA